MCYFPYEQFIVNLLLLTLYINQTLRKSKGEIQYKTEIVKFNIVLSRMGRTTIKKISKEVADLRKPSTK